MVTTRRQNGIVTPSRQFSDATTSASPPRNRAAKTADMPPTDQQPPYLPTAAEAFLLAVYPFTLVVGSAFSHLSPRLRPPVNTSTYSHAHQSFQPAEHAPSYFAQKRNVFNVYFVKIGWFWCTLALAAFVAFGSRGRRSSSTPSPLAPRAKARTAATAGTADADEADDSELDGRGRSDARLRRVYQTLLRYALATFAWILVTQWCFGAPLIDRGFRLTGGACAAAAHELAGPSTSRRAELEAAFTHAACKVAGGQWLGGHDISGHVFLLVLGSGMVFLETLPFLASRSAALHGVSGGRLVRRGTPAGAVAPLSVPPAEVAADGSAPPLFRTTSASTPTGSVKARLRLYATTLTLGIGLLCWWMLLMTAAFFHTWLEKLTGFCLAMAVLWVAYFLPRESPTWRAVVGMPGV